jgi:hypothetical protein
MQFFDSEEAVWAEMEVMISGALAQTKIRGINYAIESEDKELFAGGDEAVSIQSGNISKSGTLKLLKGAIDDWNVAARAAGGRWLTDLKVDIVVTYLPAIGRDVQIDTLVGVKVGKMPKGWEQGATNMDCELPFKFLRLLNA